MKKVGDGFLWKHCHFILVKQSPFLLAPEEESHYWSVFYFSTVLLKLFRK